MSGFSSVLITSYSVPHQKKYCKLYYIKYIVISLWKSSCGSDVKLNENFFILSFPLKALSVWSVRSILGRVPPNPSPAIKWKWEWSSESEWSILGRVNDNKSSLQVNACDEESKSDFSGRESGSDILAK